MSNSKIYLGSTNLGTGKIRLGANDVSAIYLGTSLLYPPTTPPTPTGDYLCFTANAANCTVGMTHYGTNQTTTQPVMYYSTDQTNWTLWDYSTITLANVGDKVYFYGDNPSGFSHSSSNYSKFATSGSVACSGNIMTLITKDGSETTIPSNSRFQKLFDGTTITTAPELPATTLQQYCYNNMFRDCASLVTVQSELPATTLVRDCYSSMYKGCSSLVVAPKLPATTLASYSYYSMFDGCTSLNHIEVSCETWSTANANGWVNRVASTGTFVKPAELVIGTGTGEIPLNSTSGIPTGWTTENYVPNSVKITNTSQNSGTFSVYSSDSSFPNYTNLEYSLDGGTTWTTLNTVYDTVTVPSGDSILLRGTGNGEDFDNEEFTRLNFSESHTVSGNLADLVDYTTEPLIVPNYAFYKLFNNDTTLTQANLFDTDFDNGGIDAFDSIFYGCSNLNSVSVTTNNWNGSKHDNWLNGAAATGTIYVNGDTTNIPLNSPSGIPSGWTVVDAQ